VGVQGKRVSSFYPSRPHPSVLYKVSSEISRGARAGNCTTPLAPAPAAASAPTPPPAPPRASAAAPTGSGGVEWLQGRLAGAAPVGARVLRGPGARGAVGASEQHLHANRSFPAARRALGARPPRLEPLAAGQQRPRASHPGRGRRQHRAAASLRAQSCQPCRTASGRASRSAVCARAPAALRSLSRLRAPHPRAPRSPAPLGYCPGPPARGAFVAFGFRALGTACVGVGEAGHLGSPLLAPSSADQSAGAARLHPRVRAPPRISPSISRQRVARAPRCSAARATHTLPQRGLRTHTGIFRARLPGSHERRHSSRRAGAPAFQHATHATLTVVTRTANLRRARPNRSPRPHRVGNDGRLPLRLRQGPPRPYRARPRGRPARRLSALVVKCGFP
jgi:hypothetical protein